VAWAAAARAAVETVAVETVAVEAVAVEVGEETAEVAMEVVGMAAVATGPVEVVAGADSHRSNPSSRSHREQTRRSLGTPVPQGS
jgi:hypothetical protein